jgi:hypothetical protein
MKRFTRDDTEHGQEYYLASEVNKALAQPAHVISEQEQLKQRIATTNYYRAKREYEPDEDDDDDIQVYQRPWVGLTDEDKETLILKHAPPLHPDYKDDSLHGLLQAANDFLRELNT